MPNQTQTSTSEPTTTATTTTTTFTAYPSPNNGGCCSANQFCLAPQPILFLLFTLLMTTSATAMLCVAIMTDHWEHVTWNRTNLENITNATGQKLDWILDQKVAILLPKDPKIIRQTVFLVPMHGGIWTLCLNITNQEMQLLKKHNQFPQSTIMCVNYLADSEENNASILEEHAIETQISLHPHLRMQNLSISCALVCLIILGCAAFVGAFGVCQKQISAVLITGVMYLLAALFALFTLMIIHFKRQQGRPLSASDFDGTIDGIVALPGAGKVAQNLLSARQFETSWSLDLGWGGVVLCSITSILWIFLSKIMRYNPLSAFLI